MEENFSFLKFQMTLNKLQKEKSKFENFTWKIIKFEKAGFLKHFCTKPKKLNTRPTLQNRGVAKLAFHLLPLPSELRKATHGCIFGIFNHHSNPSQGESFACCTCPKQF